MTVGSSGRPLMAEVIERYDGWQLVMLFRLFSTSNRLSDVLTMMDSYHCFSVIGLVNVMDNGLLKVPDVISMPSMYALYVCCCMVMPVGIVKFNV